jgi:multiple sugar transport system substrate-binding protein
LRSLPGAALLLCLVAPLWTGCRNFDPGPKTLVYSYGEGGEIKDALMRDLARRFEEQNEGTRVFLHALPSSTDAQRVFYLTSLMAHSSYVDLFELDVYWMAEFAAAGLLMDLSRHAAFADRSRFIEPLITQGTYDGKLYAAPYYATFGTLFYRADLLRKHNLTAPRTIDELVQQARQVGRAEGLDGFLFQAENYEGLTCTFLELYACHGVPVHVEGKRAVFDPETTKRTLQFMYDAVHTHGITPESVLLHTEVESTNAFSEGRAVFMRNWNGAYRYIREGLAAAKIGVAAMPSSQGPLSGGWLLAVNRRTEVPKLAVNFAAFLSGRESQELMTKRRGQAPALRSMYQGESRPQGLPRDLLEGNVLRPQSPSYQGLSMILTEEVRAVLQKQRSVADGARQIVRRARKLKMSRIADPDYPKTNYLTTYRP